MLNLSRKTFNSIKNKLTRQKKELEEEIKDIEKERRQISAAPPESVEPGTASWLAEVHGRAVAVKENLLQLLSTTRRALINIRSGKYGKCEICGKQIEADRLKAIPTATLCLACSKKVKK